MYISLKKIALIGLICREVANSTRYQIKIFVNVNALFTVPLKKYAKILLCTFLKLHTIVEIGNYVISSNL